MRRRTVAITCAFFAGSLFAQSVIMNNPGKKSLVAILGYSRNSRTEPASLKSAPDKSATIAHAVHFAALRVVGTLPTTVMSPRNTFTSCGRSAIQVYCRNSPILVRAPTGEMRRKRTSAGPRGGFRKRPDRILPSPGHNGGRCHKRPCDVRR